MTQSDSLFIQKKSSSLFCRAPVEAYLIYLIDKEEVHIIKCNIG